MDFKRFDQRRYTTVSAKEGYSQWAETYEDSVPDLLDLGILNRIETVDWSTSENCLDLACGTGRIGHWLNHQGARTIDGIDITPQMLERAKERGLYRNLSIGSVEKTDLASAAYDLLVMSLVDEHLETLEPVYSEAARVATEEARFIVVGMHPFFFMTGMPTHFKDKDGNPIAIDTHIHLVSDHIHAAFNAGWKLIEIHEGVIDEDWIRAKPKWEKLRDHPVNYGYVWGR